MLTVVLSLCVQSVNYPQWLTENHASVDRLHVLNQNNEGAWSWKWRGPLKTFDFWAKKMSVFVLSFKFSYKMALKSSRSAYNYPMGLSNLLFTATPACLVPCSWMIRTVGRSLIVSSGTASRQHAAKTTSTCGRCVTTTSWNQGITWSSPPPSNPTSRRSSCCGSSVRGQTQSSKA